MLLVTRPMESKSTDTTLTHSEPLPDHSGRMRRNCSNIIQIMFFGLNIFCFVVFGAFFAGTTYILLNGEDTILGQKIEPSLLMDSPTSAYFFFAVIFLIVFSFLCLFTCFGWFGTMLKSSCLLKNFIAILVIMFTIAVGGIISLHIEYGGNGITLVLEQLLSKSAQAYKEENFLTFTFWNWLQKTFQCCGVDQVDGYKIWTSSNILVGNRKVPASCCKAPQPDCVDEPNGETAFLSGCAANMVLYVQIALYGIPVIMFFSLLMGLFILYKINVRTNTNEISELSDDEDLYNDHDVEQTYVEDDTEAPPVYEGLSAGIIKSIHSYISSIQTNKEASNSSIEIIKPETASASVKPGTSYVHHKKHQLHHEFK